MNEQQKAVSVRILLPTCSCRMHTWSCCLRKPHRSTSCAPHCPLNTIINRHNTRERADSTRPLLCSADNFADLYDDVCLHYFLITVTQTSSCSLALTAFCRHVVLCMVWDFGLALVPGRNKYVQTFTGLALQQFWLTLCTSIMSIGNTQPALCPDRPHLHS